MSKDTKRRMRKRRSQTSIRVGERATPERSKQLGGLVTEVVDRDATGRIYIERQRANYEQPLDVYFRHKDITDAQYRSATRMDAMYMRINEQQSVLGNIASLVDGGGVGHQEIKMASFLDCQNGFKKALKVLTPAQRRMVMKVCCYGEYAGDKDAKATLIRGLQCLAKHWGYV